MYASFFHSLVLLVQIKSAGAGSPLAFCSGHLPKTGPTLGKGRDMKTRIGVLKFVKVACMPAVRGFTFAW